MIFKTRKPIDKSKNINVSVFKINTMKKRICMILVMVAIWTINLNAREIPHKGEFIQVKGNNGKLYRAFAAGPPDAQLGILFVHDFFGITDATRQSVERLGVLGYRTVAVDLYNGRSAGKLIQLYFLIYRLAPAF